VEKGEGGGRDDVLAKSLARGARVYYQDSYGNFSGGLKVAKAANNVDRFRISRGIETLKSCIVPSTSHRLKWTRLRLNLRSPLAVKNSYIGNTALRCALKS